MTADSTLGSSGLAEEHRHCFAIDGESGLDAVTILKTETDQPHGIRGTVLKISTFAVADRAEGAKRGELLLKSVLDYAAGDGHDRIYVEIYPHHDRLVPLFERFGFFDCERTHRPRRGRPLQGSTTDSC